MNIDILAQQIKIVLCNTSHNGNIGSTARAMKTMGIYDLTLVEPKITPDDHAIALASNAADIVINAKILDSLEEAIANSTLAIALTARRRENSQELQTPKQIMPEVINHLSQGNHVSFVFGTERTGLSISQLERCNRMVTIPGNPEYFSLNLAQAVQIICYELYSSFNSDISHLKNASIPATLADNAGVLSHLDELLTQLNYYKHKNSERTLRRLQHIIYKAHLERHEIDLIRGILRGCGQALNKKP